MDLRIVQRNWAERANIFKASQFLGFAIGKAPRGTKSVRSAEPLARAESFNYSPAMASARLPLTPFAILDGFLS
jgi:hypothetical protein